MSLPAGIGWGLWTGQDPRIASMRMDDQFNGPCMIDLSIHSAYRHGGDEESNGAKCTNAC